MHTWHGIGILVIFATTGEMENFLPQPPSPCARDAETHKRTRVAARDRLGSGDAAKKFR